MIDLVNKYHANVLIPLRDEKISNHALIRLRGSLENFQRVPSHMGDISPAPPSSHPNLGFWGKTVHQWRSGWRSGSENLPAIFEAHRFQPNPGSELVQFFKKERKEALYVLLYSHCLCFCGARYNSSNMKNRRVRDAVAEDVPDILRMIKVMKSAKPAKTAVLLRSRPERRRTAVFAG